MSMDIEEQLELASPVDTVWRFVVDPERMVTCLPGAELTGKDDDRSFRGTMKVKLGPVTVTYQGRARMTEVDETAHRMVLLGEGTEKGGAGSAKMQMEADVVATDGGATRLVVRSKVDLAGRVVQFGRGMIQGVAAQLFKQFGENLKAALAEEASAATATSPAPSAALATAPARGPLARKPAEPIRIIPLLLKVLFAPIARFFRRLVRRR